MALTSETAEQPGGFICTLRGALRYRGSALQSGAHTPIRLYSDRISRAFIPSTLP